MNSPMRLSSLKRRVNERVVSQETHETGVLMIFSRHRATVNGTVALVTEVVVLLLKMIGLVALLVVTKIGVLMIFSHRLATVNGTVALVMEVAVLLLAMIRLVVALVVTKTGVLMTFNHHLAIVSGGEDNVVLQTITINEQAVGQETTMIGAPTTFNHHQETVNGVMDNVVLHQVMIGLLALLVVTKTGAQTTSSLLQEIVSGREANVVPQIIGPVAAIRTVLTAMIIAIRTGTDASVPQVRSASQAPIVETEKAVSGCAVKDVANLAHYLKWLWMKYQSKLKVVSGVSVINGGEL